MGKLDGKVAIVTGAGQGIGRGEALLLAGLGARVVVNDLGCDWQGTGDDKMYADRVAKEIKAQGGQAVSSTESVSDFQSAKRILQTALDKYGRLDILVNNAGILRDKMLFNMDEGDWDAVVAVHLKGTFNMARHACGYYRAEAKTGKTDPRRIINTTSIVGLKGNAGQTNYAAAKAGIASFTLALAQEMKKYHTTVNAVSPAARTRLTVQTFGDSWKQQAPAGQWDPMDPDNIAPMVGYLALPEAQEVTGQVFNVRGGVIDLYQSWTPVKTIEKKGRWTVDELTLRVGELMEARPPDPLNLGQQGTTSIDDALRRR
ncbi:MAG: SDR family oxidoreductase [Euryarchaeota archaeon]|nr:SDR family oxidoreductase [Euryarchaeota archaeon]